MAGTATNYDTSTIPVDVVGQVWAGLATPSAGARITLHTDGTPDATANPNAIHLGHTKEGSKVTITASQIKHYADEVATPIKATVDVVDMMIEGSFLQIMDADVLKKLTDGFGTYGTGSGYVENTIGRKTLAYQSVALIWPTPADATKFAVAHIYQAINEAGLSWQISRKGMSETPFKFVAFAIASRAAADQVGNYWYQV